MRPRILTIAGSDPGSGAGIQADLRTFGALGLSGYSVITAVTVQNSLGVRQSFPVPAEIVYEQMTALFEDAPPVAVKIGILSSAAQIAAVAKVLKQWAPASVILDPVLASSSGLVLLDEEGRAALRQELLPLCRLITPNLPEAEALTGVNDIEAAGKALLALGAGAVLIKGGHLPGEPVDTLITQDGLVSRFSGQRIDTPHTHGTGCFLSSAIAAFLALGASLEEAVRSAKALLTEALQKPEIIGRGHGFPNAVGVFSAWQAEQEHAIRQDKLRGLYVLTDSRLRPDRSPEEITRAALSGGARIIQLRDKSLPASKLIALAKRLRAMTQEAGALLIVNDRVDIALACDADGVHLGPDDMPPADARRALGPAKLIGVSTASVAEAIPLAPYASYLAVGAVYGSSTKLDAGSAIGLEPLRAVKAAFPHLPLAAIGGISAANIADVICAGADSAAVISAVIATPDMAQAAGTLQSFFTSYKQKHLPTDTSPGI